MGMMRAFLCGLFLLSQGSIVLGNCPSGFETTILGACKDINECAGDTPCQKGSCYNTQGNFYCWTGTEAGRTQTCNLADNTTLTCYNFGKCSSNSTACTCQGGYSGTDCQTKLFCDLECRNGGTCSFLGENQTCLCPYGYTGDTCQLQVDLCSADICLNNGTCQNTDNLPTCTCTSDSSGTYCENLNGANCTSMAQCNSTGASSCTANNKCQCNSGYFGDYCQYKSDCGCLNGGISVPSDSQFCSCVCPNGTSGDKCETDSYNECLTSPCQNGGTCTDGFGTYTCTCPSPYLGYNCQTACELNDACVWSQCPDCRSKFGDGKCDGSCNTETCYFDGFDCQTFTQQNCTVTKNESGTIGSDLTWYCVSFYDDNLCIGNGSYSECTQTHCGSDGLDCISNKRSASKVLGTIVMDVIITNETYDINTTTLILTQLLPYEYSIQEQLPHFYVRRYTSVFNESGSGSEMFIQNSNNTFRYLLYLNVVNKDGCSSSGFPCWSDIKSLANYVAIYTKSLSSTLSAALNVMQIYGCSEGMYGDRCAYNCSSYCEPDERICNMNTGKCNIGCLDNMYYGDMCETQCSQNCINKTCDMNGTCTSVNGYYCTLGFKGETCQTACANATYGYDCAFNCSSYCGNTCSLINGSCTPCQVGYTFTDSQCFTACDAGTWGLNCSQQCNTCGGDASCSNVNGTCQTCPYGYYGSMCENVCADGTYGFNCENTCNTNCASVCNKTNGYCSPCKSGYQGYSCNTIIPSNDPTLQNATDSKSTIIAASLVVAALLIIALIIAYVLWKRNKGQDYKLNEVDPVKDNGHINGGKDAARLTIETDDKEGESSPLVPMQTFTTSNTQDTNTTADNTKEENEAIQEDPKDVPTEEDSQEINDAMQEESKDDNDVIEETPKEDV